MLGRGNNVPENGSGRYSRREYENARAEAATAHSIMTFPTETKHYLKEKCFMTCTQSVGRRHFGSEPECTMTCFLKAWKSQSFDGFSMFENGFRSPPPYVVRPPYTPIHDDAAGQGGVRDKYATQDKKYIMGGPTSVNEVSYVVEDGRVKIYSRNPTTRQDQFENLARGAEKMTEYLTRTVNKTSTTFSQGIWAMISYCTLDWFKGVYILRLKGSPSTIYAHLETMKQRQIPGLFPADPTAAHPELLPGGESKKVSKIDQRIERYEQMTPARRYIPVFEAGTTTLRDDLGTSPQPIASATVISIRQLFSNIYTTSLYHGTLTAVKLANIVTGLAQGFGDGTHMRFYERFYEHVKSGEGTRDLAVRIWERWTKGGKGSDD